MTDSLGRVSVKTLIMALAFAAMAAQPGRAEEMQKSGKAEFDAYMTWRLGSTISAGIDEGNIGEGTGFDRLVGGTAPFDLLTFHCVGYGQKIGEKSDFMGGCVKTDKDGDHIFYTYNSEGWTFSGGTGKFKGITGKGTSKPTYYHDSGHLGWEVIVHHIGSWEIK